MMTDKLRAAALAALEMLSEDDRNAEKCIRILRAALAEQTVQKSLTVAEPEQEPVAWYHNDFGVLEFSRHERVGWSPLYTAPPRREWVGLTDEEITQGNRKSLVDLQAWKEAVSWAEAKLREKNT